MTRTTVTKLEAARVLLDRSLEMLLDRGDYISAIVLAGSAEDVMHEILKAKGLEDVTARGSLVRPTIELHKRQYPDAPVPKSGDVHAFMRKVFNWLRHANRDEPHRLTEDLRSEASMCAMRAMENFYTLNPQSPHPRDVELVAFHRSLDT